MGSPREPREQTMVPSMDALAGASSWEVRMLLERAAELERLQRFEEALVLYHRGRSRAPLVAAFEEGVQRTAQAVDAAIGVGAAELFADIPSLLPGMIEEQAAARSRSRRAARAKHDRLKEAVKNMTFSEAGADADASDGDDEGDGPDAAGGGSGGREVACRPQQPVDGVVAIPHHRVN